jgi:HAMP domain-containing protein
MGLFGRSRRQVFKPSPYDTRRRRRKLPRWFVLLVVGILIGSGGTLILQASYGPKRLTVLESQKLTDDLAAVTLDRQQLQADLTELQRQLDAGQTSAEQTIAGLRQEISTLQQRMQPLRDEVELFKGALSAGVKFDPVGITGASFDQEKGSDSLQYQIVLVQEDDQQPAYEGRIEVTFEGRYPNGRAGAVKALVVPFTLKHYEILTGSIEMPNSLQATRATLRVYRAQGNRALSYRTYSVQ